MFSCGMRVSPFRRNVQRPLSGRGPARLTPDRRAHAATRSARATRRARGKPARIKQPSASVSSANTSVVAPAHVARRRTMQQQHHFVSSSPAPTAPVRPVPPSHWSVADATPVRCPLLSVTQSTEACCGFEMWLDAVADVPRDDRSLGRPPPNRVCADMMVPVSVACPSCVFVERRVNSIPVTPSSFALDLPAQCLSKNACGRKVSFCRKVAFVRPIPRGLYHSLFSLLSTS